MKIFKDWLDEEASAMAEYLEHTKGMCDKNIALLNMVKGAGNRLKGTNERP